MFDVIEMKFPGQPFPQKPVGSMMSPEQVGKLCRLTAKQLSWVLHKLSGEDETVIVKNRFIISLSPRFMRELALDEMQKAYGYQMIQDEIAKELGLSIDTVSVIMHNAQKKIINSGNMKQFLHAVSEMRRLRENRANFEAVVETTITVTAGG